MVSGATLNQEVTSAQHWNSLPDQYQYVMVKLQVAAPSGAWGRWLSMVAESNERALMVWLRNFPANYGAVTQVGIENQSGVFRSCYRP